MKNLYEVLQVKTNATSDQIKRAYLSLITKYHPDIYSGDKSYAERYTALITEAYSVLKDENRRQEYDESHNIKNRDFDRRSRYEYEEDDRRRVNPIKESSNLFKNTERKNPSLLRRFVKSKVFIAIIALTIVEITIALLLYLS